MGKSLSDMVRTMPPGTSSWPARANKVSTARADWTPVLEYSRPVYISSEVPLALQMWRARSRIVATGTFVITSATSGRKCWT